MTSFFGAKVAFGIPKENIQILVVAPGDLVRHAQKDAFGLLVHIVGKDISCRTLFRQ